MASRRNGRIIGFEFLIPKPNWLAFAAVSALVYDFAEALKLPSKIRTLRCLYFLGALLGAHFNG